MGIVESALKILELCSHLIAIARDVDDTAAPDEKSHATDQIWKEISDIAAQNAAKPSIDGVSLHE